MPHIGVLMERSLQDRSLKDAFADLLARSAVAALGKRQSVDGIQDGISDAKTAFSSWDNCMQASFCKWPVIGVIIVVGLIIVSIIWCCVRCLCCGVSCCCKCCYCLKCCGECCGCCDPPRGKSSKYLDEPYVPPHHAENQGYRSQAPMTPNFPPPAAAAPISAAPQYAEFDSGPKGGSKRASDALPPMPSWGDAGSKQVLIEEEPVEMEPLKRQDTSQNASLLQNAATLSHASIPSPGPMSPANRSAYGAPPGQGGPNGYMAPTRAETDPYGTNAQGYNGYMTPTRAETDPYGASGQGYDAYDTRGYGQGSQDGYNQGYGQTGVMAAGAVGRRTTPHQDYNNGSDYDDGYGQGAMNQGYPQSRTPRPYNDEYGRSMTPGSYGNGPRAPPSIDGYGNAIRTGSPAVQSGYGIPARTASPAIQTGYGHPTRMGSPGPQAAYANPTRMGSPGPQAGYGYGNAARRSPGPQVGLDYPQRSQTGTPNGYGRQPPAPYRQYSADTPVQDDGGFDIDSSYGRTASPPPQAANGGTAYPGYRPYKPAA